ncbi:MAG: diaminopimelate epimerase [Alphaproteobacteria bacterium]|nr:diaminopimelate epimerase [Alphaproteobacteria bacterium]
MSDTIGLPFTKMHGLGNDFVVLDGRREPLTLTPAQIRAIADRHTGVGCDQLVIIEKPRVDNADVFMRILNSDGSEVGACGNATRCVASLVIDERRPNRIVIQTLSGSVVAARTAEGEITVDMGPARLLWNEIPLTHKVNTLSLPLSSGPLSNPVAVSMGNPHAVFFTDDAEAVDLATLGPPIEHHPLFPERTNVEVVQVLSPERLRMRVWERGTGITRACGTGACAAVVAATLRGLTGRHPVEVILDGGSLRILWLQDNRVGMTGPALTSFTGTIHPQLLR